MATVYDRTDIMKDPIFPAMSVEQIVQARLFALQDTEYRDFQCRLIPNVAPNTVIGVRTPVLRKFAKDFAKEPEAAEFLRILPHRYFEENNLHGFLIERMKDYDRVIAALDAFLPFVDNWATCDQLRPGVFAKRPPQLREQIQIWMASGHTYTVRFGIEMLMCLYLDDAFLQEYLDWVAAIRSDEYYVNMPASSGTIALTSQIHTYTAGTGLSLSNGAFSIKTATSSELGGVKSSTTGTTANRDYKVQVNSDGTMKVNVP